MRMLRIQFVLAAFVLVFAAQSAAADYLDVIVNRYIDGCTLDKYMTLVEEFHGVMKSEGYTYRAEISVPFYAESTDAVLWVGRVSGIDVFGAENSKWQAALQNDGSPESKVLAKLNACTAQASRSAYMTVE